MGLETLFITMKAKTTVSVIRDDRLIYEQTEVNIGSAIFWQDRVFPENLCTIRTLNLQKAFEVIQTEVRFLDIDVFDLVLKQIGNSFQTSCPSQRS